MIMEARAPQIGRATGTCLRGGGGSEGARGRGRERGSEGVSERGREGVRERGSE